MVLRSTIELKNLKLFTQIGTYGPNDVVPDEHLLDLILGIDSALVLTAQDGMGFVFDYDPLMIEIDRLARDGHYDTQERLMTRIVNACAQYSQILTVDIALRKSPVLNGTGSLGVRVQVDEATLNTYRKRANT